MKFYLKIIVFFLLLIFACSNQNIIINKYDIQSLTVTDGFFIPDEGYFITSIGRSRIEKKTDPMQYIMNLDFFGKERWLTWNETVVIKNYDDDRDTEIYTEMRNVDNQIVVIGQGIKDNRNYFFIKKYSLKGTLLEKVEVPVSTGNHLHDIKLANVIIKNDSMLFLVCIEKTKSFLRISVNDKGEVTSKAELVFDFDRDIFKRTDFIKWNGKDKVILINKEKIDGDFKEYLNFLNVNDNGIKLKFAKELPGHILERNWITFNDNSISLFTRSWFYNISYEGHISIKKEFKDLSILYVLFRSNDDSIILAEKEDKILILKMLDSKGNELKSYEYNDLGFDFITSGMIIPGKDGYLLVLSVIGGKDLNYDIVSFLIDKNGKYKL